VDEVAGATVSTSFDLEVIPCTNEAANNGTPATAGPLAGGGGGWIEGNTAARGVGFFQRGREAPGARADEMVGAIEAHEGAGASFDRRIRDVTNTLDFDDLNNSSFFGGNSPNIEGRQLPAAPVFIRVTHATTSTAAEPYRLYAIVRAPGSETPESEPNDGA